MIALMLVALLSQDGMRAGVRDRDLRTGGRTHGAAAASGAAGCSLNVSCGIQAGDEVGNWYALQTDGTMLAGSALTMTGQNGPGVSPLTFNGTNQYFKSTSTVAFPSGDFSFVVIVNLVSTVGEVFSKWDGSATFPFTVEGQGAGVGYRFYVTATTGPGGASSANGASIAGSWVGLGGTYTSATGIIRLRVQGVSTGGVLSGTGVQAANFVHSLGAYVGPGNFINGSSRGLFFTEKVLSDSDIDRIVAAAGAT